jgi:four helix bundle suffix protein
MKQGTDSSGKCGPRSTLGPKDLATQATQTTKETKTPAGPSTSLPSFRSFGAAQKPGGFMPPHGGYQKLLSYQKAEIVYDATLCFCRRFLNQRDRTYDQMVQAARSGKQNIVEASQASGTSKEAEIKLTNVARASLEELITDYRDFLRQRGLAEWTLDHPYTRRLRELNRRPEANYETFRRGVEHSDPAICANVIIGLIKVTCYLLDRQLARLEQDFLEEGGLRERMTRARLTMRSRQSKRP